MGERVSNAISRRDFIRASGLAAGTFIFSTNLLEIHPEYYFSDEQKEKIANLDTQIMDLGVRISRYEGGRNPQLSSYGIKPILLARDRLDPTVRSKYLNGYDLNTWVTGDGEYGYDFGVDEPTLISGSIRWDGQAKEIYDSYLKEDQFRVSRIILASKNLTSGNGILWEAGNQDFQSAESQLSWDTYRAYIHEITHAGTPLLWYKTVNNKDILLPYGFDRTLDFVSDWFNAMNQEYDYYHNNFFQAKGDETLEMLRGGGTGLHSALNEIIAMSCADYIFPPEDAAKKIFFEDYNPYEGFPLTEAAIRKSIAYVHYGVNALDTHPNGVEPRGKFKEGTVVGDIFWRTYSFAKPGFMSKPVSSGN